MASNNRQCSDGLPGLFSSGTESARTSRVFICGSVGSPYPQSHLSLLSQLNMMKSFVSHDVSNIRLDTAYRPRTIHPRANRRHRAPDHQRHLRHGLAFHPRGATGPVRARCKGLTAELVLMTCYMGISFYHDPASETLRTGVAQVFNERGESMVVRGGRAVLDDQCGFGSRDGLRGCRMCAPSVRLLNCLRRCRSGLVHECGWCFGMQNADLGNRPPSV